MHPLLKFVSAGLALGLATTTFAAVETYEIDPVHSSVGFTVRHFFSQVPGVFSKFKGTITVDRDQLERSKAQATIEVASVDTRNGKRDDDLRSKNFFSVSEHPTITFQSKSWKKTGADTYDVTGDLSIHGVTKEVVLKTTALGFGPGMRGTMLSGWHATTTVNRNDFGVAGAKGIVGEDVQITIDVESHLVAPGSSS